MSLVNKLDKESLKFLKNIAEEVNEEFFEKPRQIKEEYEKSCKYLGFIEKRVSEGNLAFGEHPMCIFLNSGTKVISQDKEYGQNILEKTYNLLEGMEKQNQKYALLYRNLLSTYFEFAKLYGLEPRRGQLGEWENALKGESIPLIRLKLYKLLPQENSDIRKI